MVASYALSQRHSEPSASLEVEESVVKMWLPSALRTSDRLELVTGGNPLGKILVDAEHYLRLAQMQDSLDAIKRLLKSKSSTKDFTRRNLFGQRSNTRARAALTQIDKKINDRAQRYRRAYHALRLLSPNGSWQSTFLPLNKNDLKAPLRDQHSDDESEEDEEPGVYARQRRVRVAKRKKSGQGNKTESWIWERKRDSTENSSDETGDGASQVTHLDS